MRKLSLSLLAIMFMASVAEASMMVGRPYYGGMQLKAGTAFKDLPDNHPFAATIADLKTKKLVKGYQDGTFAPDNSISRAEFITMVMASIGSAPAYLGSCFSDVRDEWFAPFVCAAKTRGFVSGYSDGSFKPSANINFAEASAIIAKAHRLRPRRAFKSEPWYKPAIAKLETRAAIPTSIDYVSKKLSRSETAEMLWRLNTKTQDRPTKTYAAVTAQVPMLSSCAELEEKITLFQYQQAKRYADVYKARSFMMDEGEEESSSDSAQGSVAAPTLSKAKVESGGSGATDYSKTNVQVEGVDEPDFIKNDGKYIYMVSGRTVRIIEAFPPTAMTQVARLEVSDTSFSPSDIFVSGDKLVILGSTYYSVPLPAANEKSPAIVRPSVSRTKAFVINLADRKKPLEERAVEFEGNNVSSRLIGSRLYLIVNNTPNFYALSEGGAEAASEGSAKAEAIIPHYRDSRIGNDMPVVPCTSIRFLPQYDNLNFLTVASFDVASSESQVSKDMIMGAGDTIYASTQSIYVASERYAYPDIGIYDIWAPPVSQASTVFFRFGIENGTVTYKTKGEIPGTLLNQFAMDEEGSAFRVATTIGEAWNTANPSKNNIFILDRNNLQTTLGKIVNIAPGERIYSVRFLGKRAYIVTFKKVDPFFVIDVGDPMNPKILGELKIPGYSDYLHPYDENHIIGFGKEAVDPRELREGGFGGNPSFDFAWYQGMKIALFDVTDVGNPKVLFKELVGDRGTESELLHNHRALLYDKARNLFAFPVTVHEVKDKTPGAYTGSTYGTPVFQGAYVYTLDLEKGFQFKGKITHHTDTKPFEQGWYYEGGNTIKRILFMGDYLYTVSFGKVKATERETMKETATLELEYSEPSYRGWEE